MPLPGDFNKLVHDNEQDRAECLAWWRHASNEHKMALIRCVQQDYGSTITEVMSRFAQLAISEMVEQEMRMETK